MSGKNKEGLEMNSSAIYEIRVRGILSEQWAEWFNGMLQDHTRIDQGRPQTSLVCQVRDQSELLGILKQLNALNLPLVQVALFNGADCQKGAKCHDQ